MTGNLDVHLGANFTLGHLTLGGTGAAVTTDVGHGNAGGGTITFDNTGGVNNSDGTANASITSGGVAGSTNIISAPINLIANTNITTASTNDLTLSGGIVLTSPAGTAVAPTLVANHAAGLEVHIGNITSAALVAPTAGITNRLIVGHGNDSTTFQRGTVYLDGVISNGAPVGGFNVNTAVTFGASGANNANTTGTVVVNGNNTFSGGTTLLRVNLVLGHNNALGTGTMNMSGAAGGAVGMNIASTDDARNIANNFTMQRNVTFNGDHSLTWSGIISQSNTSNLFNLLPAGKTLTLADINADNTGGARTFTFDGRGETIVTGALRNSPVATSDLGDGRYVKNGSGTVTSNGTNTYTGATFVSGGLFQFGSAAGYTTTSSIAATEGGAVGALDGSTGAAFLGKLQSSIALSTGALALDDSDAAVNLDFTGSGNMSHVNTVGMSVGATLPGVSYTGTITPAVGVGYRLGGGGTLTLPNANQLTGANNVSIVSGGTVALNAANNYSGTTTIKGNYVPSLQQAAAVNNGGFVTPGVFIAPTLAISNPAALGTSADTADKLVISGGTLKYTGSGHSSSRLFTITPAGATLDASGSGAINLTNTGAASVANVSGAITGNTTTGGNIINAVTDISQLSVGMEVSGGDLPAGTTITGFQPVVTTLSNVPTGVEYRIRTSANAVTAQTGVPLTFGNQDRTLTLTGTNTGANTLAAGLGDATLGQLSVAKAGPGTWNLTGTQSYTGSVGVVAGKLAYATNLTTASAVNVTGGVLELSAGGASNRVIKTPAVSVTGGKIDLKDNKLITATPAGTWNGTNYTDVAGLVDAGRGSAGNALWDGASGIVTSDTRAINNGDLVSIGVAKVSEVRTVADTETTTFAGQTVLGSDTLAMATWGGDANLDGKINIDDYGRIDGNVGQSGTVFGWSKGDFNYDGKINIDDYGIIDGNINRQGAVFPTGSGVAGGAALEGVAAVPEPASLSLVALGAMSLMRRRRRVH